MIENVMKRYSIYLGLLLMLGSTLSVFAQSSGDGYDPDNPAEPINPMEMLSYKVAVTTDMSGAGTLTGSGTYKFGTNVTIKTTVNTGYRFLYWLRNDETEPCSTAPSYNHTMGTEDVSFKAVFEKAKHVSVARNDANGGTATVSRPYSAGTSIAEKTVGTNTYSGTYPYQGGGLYSTTQLIYTPSEVGGAKRITSIAFYVSTVSSFKADIQIYMGYKSTSTFSGATDCVNASSLSLVYSGNRNLATTTGWEIIYLDTPFDYDGTNNLVVAITKSSTAKNTTCRYRYSSGSYTQLYRTTTTANPQYASIENAANFQRVQYRPNTKFGFTTPWTLENTTISTTVNDNYTFLHWLKDEETVPYSTETSFVYGFDYDEVTFTAVYEYHEPPYTPDNPAEPLTEADKMASYNVHVALNDAAAGAVSGAGKYIYGKTVTISTSANAGYEFRHWLKDAETEPFSTQTSFSYTVGAEDVDFTAVYAYVGIPEPPAPITHKLFLVAEPAGSCTFSMAGGADVEEDTDYSVTVTPGTDQNFLGWYVGGSKVSDELTYNSTMLTEDVTLTARLVYNPDSPDEPTNNNYVEEVYAKGDIDKNGKINVSDAIDLIGYYLAGTTGLLDARIADLDGNGVINVSDAIEIIDIYLNNK